MRLEREKQKEMERQRVKGGKQGEEDIWGGTFCGVGQG